MSYSLEEIAGTLKSARQKKQLSQRELSEKVGLPQSHISKIENARVDLKLSSLNELARALELELVLVPKKVLPAVQSLTRTARDSDHIVKARSSAETRAFRRLQRSAEQLQKLQPNLKALRQIERNAEQLRRLQLPSTSFEQIRQAATQLEKFQKTWKDLKPYNLDPDTLNAIRSINDDLNRIRNNAVHSVTVPSLTVSTSTPAYQLTPDEEDG